MALEKKYRPNNIRYAVGIYDFGLVPQNKIMGGCIPKKMNYL